MIFKPRQTEYPRPQFVPKGSRLIMHYTYDNSTNNVPNPNQLPKRVYPLRQHAIRVALGAGRGQLIRQLLTESLLLCALGGLGGWLLATTGLAGLIRLSPPDLPRRVHARAGHRRDGFSVQSNSRRALDTASIPEAGANRPPHSGED